MQKLAALRRKHPQFIYQSHSYKLVGRDLQIVFEFQLKPNIVFRPKIKIKNVSRSRLDKIGEGALDNFIFHLGLIEMLSYWKAACPSEIMIRAGFLNQEQIKWWRSLIVDGLGQFFYENKIDWRGSGFLKIDCVVKSSAKKAQTFCLRPKNRYLVAFAGGRDSIVTLEKLKKQKRDIGLFMVNPNQQIQRTAEVAGIGNKIIIERKIDPVLLRLNKKGYLNGHTPFTALLSFLAVLSAALLDYRNVVFSNEKSSNEGNIKYLGKTINHQWAKSSQFEGRFKAYYKKYLAGNIGYLNYVRRYSELEISKMMVKYPKYFSFFSSCNSAMRIKSAGKERWCGQCPKCLFVYASLYPYLAKKELLKIFGRDLFENKKLLPVMKSLLGQGRHKPFECVGTYRESRRTFELSFKKAKASGRTPYLLTKL